jgi:hypothetical protein
MNHLRSSGQGKLLQKQNDGQSANEHLREREKVPHWWLTEHTNEYVH